MIPLLSAALPFLSASMGYNMSSDAAERQQAYNMSLAKYKYDRDREMMEYQNVYNSPKEQMKRFQEAGLNPFLIYGQGSPGNMQSAPSFPDVKPADLQSYVQATVPQLQQMRLAESQIALTEQKVQESGVKQDLNKAQANLIKANPYMRKEYVDSLVLQLQSTAKLKEQEAKWSSGLDWVPGQKPGEHTLRPRGMQKMDMELKQLYQRFNLNEADQKIKAEVFQSKDFQNALLEIQKKWLEDGDITPQHIYQGIMLLLTKMM